MTWHLLFSRLSPCGPQFADGANDVNENSLVVLLKYRTLRTFLMGDAGFKPKSFRCGTRPQEVFLNEDTHWAADLPPYMNAYGNIERILTHIQAAATPPKFTQDYFTGELRFSRGSALFFLFHTIPYAKRIGLIGSDGTPADLYKRFRNTNAQESGRAIADAMKIGYQVLYKSHE